MTTVPTVGPHVRANKVKLIATTGPKRVSVFPQTPTVSESGLPGYELTNSYAFFAPAGTPPAIVTKLNAELMKGMRAPETMRIVAADGGEVPPAATAEEFRTRFLRTYAEMEDTTRVARIRLN